MPQVVKQTAICYALLLILIGKRKKAPIYIEALVSYIVNPPLGDLGVKYTIYRYFYVAALLEEFYVNACFAA